MIQSQNLIQQYCEYIWNKRSCHSSENTQNTFCYYAIGMLIFSSFPAFPLVLMFPLVPNELNSLSLPSELSFPLRISFTSLSNSTSFLFREDHLEFEKDAARKYNDKQKSVNIWLTTTERSVSQLPHTAKNIKAVEAQLQQVLVSQTLLNNWQLCNK